MGTLDTLRQLYDTERRLDRPHSNRPIPDNLHQVAPADPLELDLNLFLAVVRSACRGSAAGLSGMTVEYLRLLLEFENTMQLLGFSRAVRRSTDPGGYCKGRWPWPVLQRSKSRRAASAVLLPAVSFAGWSRKHSHGNLQVRLLR